MQQAQFAVAPNKVVVNKQFNSPINLYSTQSLNETLAKQTTVLCNGAIGINFHQLAAPNLAKSAVLRMLEEEESTGSRGELSTCSTPAARQPAKLSLSEKRWPPPSAPTASPPRHRKPPDTRKAAIAWPPSSAGCTLHTTNEQSNSSLHQRFSNHQGGLKRVAWPPPPDDSVISATADQDFQQPQGESNHVNGVTLQANPPAPLYYSLPPTQQKSPRWEASPVAPNNNASPPVSVFSLPPKVNTPPPPPSTVTLRPQAPVSQLPPPVYKSQPAIEKQTVIRSAGKMRGDQKWPPAEYKAMKEAEQIANTSRGPAIKPKLKRKDYSSFFAQHALTSTYPGYRAPPGTQHYDEQGRPINGDM